MSEIAYDIGGRTVEQGDRVVISVGGFLRVATVGRVIDDDVYCHRYVDHGGRWTNRRLTYRRKASHVAILGGGE